MPTPKQGRPYLLMTATCVYLVAMLVSLAFGWVTATLVFALLVLVSAVMIAFDIRSSERDR